MHHYVAIFTILFNGIYFRTILSQQKSANQKNPSEEIIPQGYFSVGPAAEELKKGITSITVHIFPESISSIEPQTMEFVVDLKIVIKWKDERLLKSPKSGEPNLNMPKEVATKLWKPSIRLQNCKRCKHAIVDPQGQTFQLAKNKIILLTVESFYAFSCDIDLTNYPFDSQECSIVFANDGNVKFAPLSPDAFQKPGIDLQSINVPPGFTLTAITARNYSNEVTETREYVFHLRRNYANHIMLLFVPTLLIVVLSWISFWLDPEASAPRVALGLTSLLTLATQLNNAQNGLPPASTVKALDIWMFACIFCVFSSLVEFAVSNQWFRRCKNSKVGVAPYKIKCLPQNSLKNGLKSGVRTPAKTPFAQPQVNSKKGLFIDFASRVVFPCAFVIFNVIYWSYFINQGKA